MRNGRIFSGSLLLRRCIAKAERRSRGFAELKKSKLDTTACLVLRQKENAPKGMDASKMSAPKVAQNMCGMQAYLGMQEWMQAAPCRGRGLGSGRVAPPHSLEQCRREDSKGDEREALSFAPRGPGRRTASPARLHPDGWLYSDSISWLWRSKCKIALRHCCTFEAKSMGSSDS